MAPLTQIINTLFFFPYFSVRGAGASDEPRFVSKTAGVYTHLQPIKFRVKQDKRVRPAEEDKKGKVSAQRCISTGALLDSGSYLQQRPESSILTS